jgi:heptaprenyl diphosphate synthase
MKEFEAELTGFARAQKGFLGRLAEYVLNGSGKRLRPALVHLSSQFGSAPAAPVLQTALSVELIHIATLIHDDLVDEASLRRQKPTVAVKFGESSAVLLGDFVYAQAFQRLAALNSPSLLRIFADTTLAMCEGEIGQVERRYRFDLPEADYLEFLDKKTASLMAASCRAGAELAGLPDPQVRALESFGRALGLAFQITDDILDLEGEENFTGKTLRTDLTHGKMTLPLIHYSAKLKNEAERADFFETLKSPNGHINDVIGRVRDAGSIAYSREKVAVLLEEAGRNLSLLPDRPARRLLSDMAAGLSNRRT